MSLFGVSDGFAFHVKALRAGDDGVGLWVRAGSWSSNRENLTDGWIPAEVAEALCAQPARWEKLVAARLVERDVERGGYQLRNFLRWNPSREEVLAKSQELGAKRSEAGRAGAAARWHGKPDGKPPGDRWQSDGKADGKTMAKNAPDPDPDPDPRSSDPLLRAPARVESDPERAEIQPGDDPWSGRSEVPPSPPELPDRLTLAETYGAVEARPAGELDKLARELAAEGNAFGARCVGYLDSGAALPPGMRKTLREILDERSRPRPSGVRRTPSLTAGEQALVTAYLAAQKRYRRVDSPQLELHGRAAQRALTDLETLARSLRREGFEPTALMVWEHKLEQYFAISDPRLAEHGYPMPLVLARTDGLDLPRPKRKRDPPPAGPSIVQAEPRASEADIRAAAAKFGWSQEALEKALKETGT